MTPFTKTYVYGLIRSFDNGAYMVLLPGAETVTIDQDTVQDGQSFPGELMEDGHLRPGTTLELCVTEDAEGRRDFLPCPSGNADAVDANRETATCGSYVREHKRMLSSRRSRRAYLSFTDVLDIVIGLMKEKKGRIDIILEEQGWISLSFEGPLADGDYGRFLEVPSVRSFLDGVWVLSGRIRRPGCIYYVTHLAQSDFKSIRLSPLDGSGSSISLSYRIDSVADSYSRRHISHILHSYRMDCPGILFFLAPLVQKASDESLTNG